MKNNLNLPFYRIVGCTIGLLFLLPRIGNSQEVEYFKCPGYELPPPDETPEAICQTCDPDPEHLGFSCEMAIGKGTFFKNASDIGDFITGNVCINGDFYVDQPFVFQDAVVRICKGAAIYVEGNPLGLGLTIDHSEFFSCTGLWKGIQLRQEATITTKNNSKIEDAEIAINTPNYPPSFLFIENTIFNRNRIGINLRECTEQSGLPCILPISTGLMYTFRGNQFTCTAPLKGTSNEYTYAGVKMKSSSIIDFPNSSFTRFSDLSYGIVAEGRCDIGATKMIFQRIKYDGIYLEKGTLKLYDSNFFHCRNSGVRIDQSYLADLKDVTFVSPSGEYGVQINSTYVNAPLNFNRIIFHGDDGSGLRKVGIDLRGISTGTKIKIDGGSIFNIWGNSSAGISLGGLPVGSSAEITGNSFRTSSIGDALFGNYTAAGIITGGSINNLSITSNEFTAYAPSYYDTNVDRGIALGTNISGTNNEISGNLFNDEVLTLHDAIFVNGFQNMKYCSNILSGSRANATGFNFRGTCTGTDLTGNIMTFGDASPDFSSVALLIQNNTQIGAQLNRGNEWHNFLGSEPLHHAKCTAVPAFNKIFVHTPQSTCADENNPNCFYKYHPRKVTPDIDNEFFDIDPMGSPAEGCSNGGGTDELDSKIAQNLFEAPSDDPAMGWVLERYLYQKFKEKPFLVSQHTSFSSFMSSKENTTVGRFYEIQKNIDIAIKPSESIDLQSNQALVDLGDLMESVKEVDEAIEVALSDAERALLIQNKIGLLDQFELLNRILDSLRIEYENQITINLIPVFTQNESVSTYYLYETNEKTVNQIYLLSLIQQGGKLTASQIQTLQAIAQQDPKLGGPAVHRALGMLPECARTEISDAFLAHEGQYLKEPIESEDRIIPPSKTQLDGKIMVSPNPAHSNFKVTGLSKTKGLIFLLDLQGKLILSNTFNGSEVVTELTSNTPSGLYLLKIIMEDGSNHLLKLFVQSN